MTIKELRTKKRCNTCGGKFMLENEVIGDDVHETLFCENYCFTKTKIKKPTNTWAHYIMKDGKKYMSNNLNPGVFRETVLIKNKKGMGVEFLPTKYTEQELTIS